MKAAILHYISVLLPGLTSADNQHASHSENTELRIAHQIPISNKFKISYQTPTQKMSRNQEVKKKQEKQQKPLDQKTK